MDQIKYVVVCKKGYLFTSNKYDIKEFVETYGKKTVYYIGYFKPLEDISFLSDINTSSNDLGDNCYRFDNIKSIFAIHSPSAVFLDEEGS